MATVPWGTFCGECAHRRTIPAKPEDDNGYCAALNVGDWMRGELGFLWDGLKICHIRREHGPADHPLRFAERQRVQQPWQGWTVIYERGRAYQRLRPPRRPGWRLAPDPLEWIGRRIR